jgi:hypothetical protein
MEEFLANATPNQLLMCAAGPIVGAIIFGSILFFVFAGRGDKKHAQQMKLGTQLKMAPSQVFTGAPPAGSLTSSEPSPEPLAELDPRLLLSQALSPEPSDSMPSPATETDLSLTVLSHPAEGGAEPEAETEEFTMGLLRQPREDRMGLAARINSRPLAATETTKPMSSQPTPSQLTPPPPVGQVSQPVSGPQAASKPAAPVELLRLLRDPQSGQLIVEIAGRRYTKLAEISDKKIGEHILKLAAHLLAFTNGMIATEAGVKSLPAPKVGETPLPLVAPKSMSQLPDPLTGMPSVSPSPSEPAPRPSPEVEAAYLASLSQPAKPSTPEPQPQRRGLFGRAKPAAQEKPLLPVLNLAEQINTIAQTRLRMSPLAATTQLEITSDPGGGIRIDFNGHFYPSPDDIPDPEVKALIKDSIQQWEKS